MGWNSANEYFDPVADAFIALGAPAEIVTPVLTVLVRALKDGDWDTEDESEEKYKDHPAIVAAFIATCRCCHIWNDYEPPGGDEAGCDNCGHTPENHDGSDS
jgi:hypothetical protein